MVYNAFVLFLTAVACFQGVLSTCNFEATTCTNSKDCCKGYCDVNVCAPCTRLFGQCTVSEECCGNRCLGGYCFIGMNTVPTTAKPCLADGSTCNKNNDCCNKVCTTRECGTCKRWGNCNTGDECCTGECLHNLCKPLLSAPTTTKPPCVANDNFCKLNSHCCSKFCFHNTCISHPKPSTKGTTARTTKPPTKGTTARTTKPPTKGTTARTTKPTKGTTARTTKPTKGTTTRTTKPTKGTTARTTKPTKGTTARTTKPTKGTTARTTKPTRSTTTTTTTTTEMPCKAEGDACISPDECCSENCEDHVCVGPLNNSCGEFYDDCTKKSDCCDDMNCLPNFQPGKKTYKCDTDCIDSTFGAKCDADDQCCTGTKCVNNQCKDIDCVGLSEFCGTDSDCCTGTCIHRSCQACSLINARCTDHSDCCGTLNCVNYKCFI